MAIHASDPITHAGLIEYIRKDSSLYEVDGDSIGENDVFVVSVETVEISTLEILRKLSNASIMRFLLIVESAWNVNASAAITHGVHGILRYSACSPGAFSQTLLAISGGVRPHTRAIEDMITDSGLRRSPGASGNDIRESGGVSPLVSHG
ncbi:hypothetical protein [Streptomyces sp. NPDC093109]|uniref:hypothetical protein n=1 Tax=Streptomyces sp. NPDC093109 TaxID=3154977 RepID=UPI00344F201C